MKTTPIEKAPLLREYLYERGFLESISTVPILSGGDQKRWTYRVALLEGFLRVIVHEDKTATLAMITPGPRKIVLAKSQNVIEEEILFLRQVRGAFALYG